MSISEQVKELRTIANNLSIGHNMPISLAIERFREAANTIESISTKLQAANMERSAEDCGGWVIASERMPEEERCIDPETGYYGRSDDVLCSAYNEYEMRDEIWIDYTIDGEWQTHEWYEGEKLAWMPLPASYREINEP